MEKYVVFTGSFNPPTKAHCFALKTAMEAVGAERGCFLPVCDACLEKKMIKAMQRLALKSDVRIKMLESLCSENEGMEVSDYEVKTGDSDHTYKTLLYFTKSHPNEEIYALYGADKLKNIPHWHNADELLREIHFVVFDRADLNAEKLIAQSSLLSKYKDHFIILQASEDFTDVSASKVREKFLQGDKSYRDMLTPSVADLLAEIDLDQYPEPTVYDWIDLMLKGGPYDKAAADKKIYKLNKEIFKTMDLSSMLDGTKLLSSVTGEQFEHTIKCPCAVPEIEKNDDILGTVRSMKMKHLNPVIISDTCFSRACGFYDQGDFCTFESELCRISTLSQSLYKFGSPRLKCVHDSDVNLENKYPLTLDFPTRFCGSRNIRKTSADMIYTPDVEFIRGGAKNGYRLLDDKDRVTCDVLSVPSVDLTKKHKSNHIEDFDYDNGISDAVWIQSEILRAAVHCAVEMGHDAVILSSFGTGYHFPLEASCMAIRLALFNNIHSHLKNVAIVAKQSRNYQKEFWPGFDDPNLPSAYENVTPFFKHQ